MTTITSHLAELMHPSFLRARSVAPAVLLAFGACRSAAPLDAGASVRGYDPEGIEQARALMPAIEYFEDPYKAAEGADAVVLVTEWDVLRALDLNRLAATMSQPILVDLRNVYPPEDVEAAGLQWFGIGKAPRQAE